jgi:biotin carboxyl carrier protein
MKLKAQLLEQEHQLSFSLGEGSVGVTIDDRRYEMQVRKLAPEEYLLINGSTVYKCRVSQRRDSHPGDQSFEVVLRGKNYDVALVDPKRLRSATNSGSHHTGAAEIVSPMPGKIVRVLVKPGDTVEAGAGVIVVEAMKMQNEMKAPKAGIVVSIEAAEGATVNAGDVLAVIE